MFRLPCLLLALSLLGSCYVVPEGARPEVALDAAVASQFNFRGMTNVDAPVLQTEGVIDLPTKLDTGFVSLRAFANWEHFKVDQVRAESLQKYRGRVLGEIAKEEGKTAFDVMLDIAIEDDLQTYFMPPVQGTDDETWALRGRLWKDDRTLIGASDAGAHLDMIDTFAFSSQVLGAGVRERGLIPLEEAIHQLTDVPARYYGLKERGRLEEGWHADVVVFDAGEVGLGETYTKYDLPAGAGRLYAEAKGIEHVFANGVEIVREGKDTGKRPGTVLRSGKDTDTVEVPGGR